MYHSTSLKSLKPYFFQMKLTHINSHFQLSLFKYILIYFLMKILHFIMLLLNFH